MYFSCFLRLSGNALAVQWLGLCALTAKGPSSVSGQGTKIPQAAQHDSPQKIIIINLIFICSRYLTLILVLKNTVEQWFSNFVALNL